ncbi:MAG: class I SAM-dependent methyltransferase [Pseudomonadota bacterium]
MSAGAAPGHANHREGDPQLPEQGEDTVTEFDAPEYAAAWADYARDEADAEAHPVMRYIAAYVLCHQLETALPRPLTVLDLGCGTGALFVQMRRFGMSGIRYRGIDGNPDLVAACRAHVGAQEACQLADLANGDEVDRVLRDSPAPDLLVACRLFNNLDDSAVQSLLDRMAAHCPGALLLQLEPFDAPPDAAEPDPSDSAHITTVAFNGVAVRHYQRSRDQFGRWFDRIGAHTLSWRPLYLKSDAHPTHLFAATRFAG